MYDSYITSCKIRKHMTVTTTCLICRYKHQIIQERKQKDHREKYSLWNTKKSIPSLICALTLSQQECVIRNAKK